MAEKTKLEEAIEYIRKNKSFVTGLYTGKKSAYDSLDLILDAAEAHSKAQAPEVVTVDELERQITTLIVDNFCFEQEIEHKIASSIVNRIKKFTNGLIVKGEK